MGLGKTLQTLSLFQYVEEYVGEDTYADTEFRPYLVICPLSVLGSWMTEAKKWAPSLNAFQFHGSVAERSQLKKLATGQSISPVKLVVTTYETFVSDKNWFKSAFIWRYVVLDEGHKIKNDASHVSIALQGLTAEYRLILTGTPLQNNMLEMWALLHWLYPNVFTKRTSDLFERSFDLAKGQVRTETMESTRKLLELICLRRMKDSPEVNLGLPPKQEIHLFVPLTPVQRFWYTRLLAQAGNGVIEDLFRDAVSKEKAVFQLEAAESTIAEHSIINQDSQNNNDNGVVPSDKWEESKKILQDVLELERAEPQGKEWRLLMNLVMQLRKICNHPYMMPSAQPEDYFVGEHVALASGKFVVLKKLLEELVVRQRKKVLIFSGFTSALDLVEDLLALIDGVGTSFKYGRFDGSTGRARRNLTIRLFNSTEEHKVLLISTRAGGLGINLATATEVIFLDEDWNPQITLQAEARAHRIGQTKPVTIYKICTQGTVEEQMLGRIRKKLYLSTKITESMKSVHESPNGKKRSSKTSTQSEEMPQMDTGTLKSLIRRGAQTLSHPNIDATEMLSWDLQTILDKCRDRFSDKGGSDNADGTNANEVDEQAWLATMEKVETAVFEGKQVVRNAKPPSEILPDEITREDRRKGKNTTVMIDGFAVAKQSLDCDEWEAVPTLAGKDPRLADVKREKKAPPNNQNHCQLCWDGGDLVLCARCPRAYHYSCLTNEFRAKTKGITFTCSQHSCVSCKKTASDAGGMIYRCRWCEHGFCEDCLDFNKTELLGEQLIEYELVDFPPEVTAFYIKCPLCMSFHQGAESIASFFEEQKRQFEEEHAERFAKFDKVTHLAGNSAAANEHKGNSKMPLKLNTTANMVPSVVEHQSSSSVANSKASITTNPDDTTSGRALLTNDVSDDVHTDIGGITSASTLASPLGAATPSSSTGIFFDQPSNLKRKTHPDFESAKPDDKRVKMDGADCN